MKFDYVVVGAGLTGSTLAERIASQMDKQVLVVEKKKHIAGHCFDYHNENDILIHKYGPHIFHTKIEEVWNYLSNFTNWRLYQHRVLSYVDGKLVPIPINLDTVNKLLGTDLSKGELSDFFDEISEPIDEINSSADVVLSQVGEYFYEKMFKNYTKKQWGVTPDKLDPEVISRVPIRENRDDRYFDDPYQGMPENGYTTMVRNMLDHPNIKLLLGLDYKEMVDEISFGRMIYTGPIDYYFDYKCGKLPYRSLEMEFETYNQEQYQPSAVVNYPNNYDFTRVTEFKHMTGQESGKTTILKEYPKGSSAEKEPYYPVFDEEAGELADQYREEAKRTDTIFAGRLATYEYLDMDVAVSDALEIFKSKI
ncbi:MAG: UDP-galactopyranose mutase [Candidatus Acetothermia bacterium]